jgi:hypothetical protein
MDACTKKLLISLIKFLVRPHSIAWGLRGINFLLIQFWLARDLIPSVGVSTPGGPWTDE